ncbi:hypothetical protein BT67DRAFT_163545 [Trichocladium antarcticum]|uniref:Uncharacterized protein n=1 Tax=Trichocladium antarcticum TaxID=1450529 RepID=A0AAN6UDS5_9PEZI|nr:hypothetical protein BT67DRAFT_163545 [Trichocladium antarcticum]
MKQAPNPTGEADPACVYAPDAGMWPKGEKIHVRNPVPYPASPPALCNHSPTARRSIPWRPLPPPVGWRSMACRPDEQQAPVQAVLRPHGNAAVTRMPTCSKPRNPTCDGGRSIPITVVRESFSSIARHWAGHTGDVISPQPMLPPKDSLPPGKGPHWPWLVTRLGEHEGHAPHNRPYMQVSGNLVVLVVVSVRRPTTS